MISSNLFLIFFCAFTLLFLSFNLGWDMSRTEKTYIGGWPLHLLKPIWHVQLADYFFSGIIVIGVRLIVGCAEGFVATKLLRLSAHGFVKLVSGGPPKKEFPGTPRLDSSR